MKEIIFDILRRTSPETFLTGFSIFTTLIISIISLNAHMKSNVKIQKMIEKENRKLELFQKRLNLYEDLLNWTSNLSDIAKSLENSNDIKNQNSILLQKALIESPHFVLRSQMYASKQVREALRSFINSMRNTNKNFLMNLDTTEHINKEIIDMQNLYTAICFQPSMAVGLYIMGALWDISTSYVFYASAIIAAIGTIVATRIKTTR